MLYPCWAIASQFAEGAQPQRHPDHRRRCGQTAEGTAPLQEDPPLTQQPHDLLLDGLAQRLPALDE